MKSKLVVLLLLSGAFMMLPDNTFAQQAEFEAFQQAASYQSVLYRGRAPQLYTGLLYNGHYFWLTKEFLPGSLTFNGKHYTNVLLNIDACAQELLVQSKPGAPAVVVDRSRVTELEIGGQKFINLELAGQKGALPGFYRIACEDPLIYQRIDKRMNTSPENVNGDTIGYEDPDYRTDVLNYFARDERFYVLKDGKLKKISRRKARKMIR